jgi:hypothetical protein
MSYDPTIGRWLSEDPIGFEAGDANKYRYVGNEATTYLDPDGLAKYRDDFIAETPALPEGWQVHHRYQQAEVLKRRYLLERGVDVDQVSNCRGVSPQIHGEINAIQTKFWASKAEELNTTVKKVKEIVPLEEVDRLIDSIDAKYKDLWVPPGASTKEIERVRNRVRDALEDVFSRGKRIGSVLQKAGVALGIFALFSFFKDNAAFAQEVVNPSPICEDALDELKRQYRFSLNEAIKTGTLSQNRFGHLHQALREWMSAAQLNEKVRALIDGPFAKIWAEMPR